MLDPRNFEIEALLQSLEANFKSGSIKGMGEIFINNARSNSKRKLRRKGETDSEVMRQRLIPLHPVTQYEGATELSVGERVVGRESALCLCLSRVAPLRA